MEASKFEVKVFFKNSNEEPLTRYINASDEDDFIDQCRDIFREAEEIAEFEE